ncbi:hypothetical protein CASFOL_030545 [Castilleja foliolosa]|uniref:Uncharacterized protein n=1 Tax=Castilleja foliolosa TaxID=1961234 RepID=A0ABD3C9X9_9LAMI
MNSELVRVKREVGEKMARKGDKRKKAGKSKLPAEGVITEEMLDVEVGEPEKVSDNTLNDNPSKPGEVTEEMLDVGVEEPEQLITEELVTGNSKTCTEVAGDVVVQEDAQTVKVNEEVGTDSGKTCTDVTGNEVVQDDKGTVKVTKNMVDDPLEKAGDKACTGEGKRSTCISNVDEQPKKAPLKKPRVSKKAAKAIVIQEPEVERDKTRGANSNAGAMEKGKAVVVTDKTVDGGKRRKPDVTKPKALTPKRTKSVLGECSSKKQRTDDADIDIYPSLKTRNNGYTLINAFKCLTNEQRDTVRSMVWGLLEFNIAETPSTLGYWLLENFDHMACVVKLQEGRELRVEADDVTHVLGIPNGDTIIKRFAKNIPHPVVTQWKALFPDHLKSITAAHVADKMLSKETNTVWFKRLFFNTDYDVFSGELRQWVRHYQNHTEFRGTRSGERIELGTLHEEVLG